MFIEIILTNLSDSNNYFERLQFTYSSHELRPYSKSKLELNSKNVLI